MKRLLLIFVVACETPAPPPKAPPPSAPAAPTAAASQPTADVVIDPGKLRTFARLPAFLDAPANPTSEAKALLGKTLFFDKRVSGDGSVSCNDCHTLEKWGADGKALSPKQRRNTPTVLNAAGHATQFIDGRGADLESAIHSHLLDVMGNANEKALEARLKKVKGYAPLFGKDPISFANTQRALAVFVRTLLMPARWDLYIAGEDSALSTPEKQGFNLFVDTGCIACHSGAFVGGHIIQKLGATKPWPKANDKGRAEFTKSAGDEYMFKVFSLRNVDKTAPYFHDGSVATLEEAIFLMGEHQLGKKLPVNEVKLMAAWMRSLNSELPARVIEPPALPN